MCKDFEVGVRLFGMVKKKKDVAQQEMWVFRLYRVLLVILKFLDFIFDEMESKQEILSRGLIFFDFII